MKRQFLIAAGVAATLMTGQTAQAAECKVDVSDTWDLTEDAIVSLYDCIENDMAQGYASKGNETAAAYRGWTVTSTRPAVAGPHGNRLLQTFANDMAAEEYLKFASEGVDMPAGAILAKESIGINKKKEEARVGPLFIMEKLDAGGAPDAQDWLYSAVQPNGKPMRISQSFCADCHMNWKAQDSLAYPLEEVRVSD